jgi:hypothetical protein
MWERAGGCGVARLDATRLTVILKVTVRHGGEPVSTRATNLSAHAGAACASQKTGNATNANDNVALALAA